MSFKTSKHLVLSIIFLLIPIAFAMAGDNTEPSQDAEHKSPDIKNSEINWIPFDTGLVAAKREDKHVFVRFTTSWCKWCDKMDKETFTKPEVVTLVKENFIAVKVDGDSNEKLDIDGFKITEKKLTRYEFGVRGYPTFCFLNSDGANLGCFSGYRPKDALIKYLNYVKDEKYDTTKTETSTKNTK
ncbi:MAG: DUF255 domain-containing protein [candidate division Zixibacteria bacterium]|nr:DUF255 domain-containing protein [candidate division Zixibacteria bacterium]